MDPGGAGGAVCSVCGTAPADDDPAALLIWMRETDDRGRVAWVCPVCTRTHVRAVEAKLDHEWW
jgi:hypothetical protein